MTLHGPAHPEEFRVSVGRFGDRHYHDPLPACPIAEATEEVWPSVSTIKKAAARDFSFVTARRVAEFAIDFQAQWRGLKRDAALELLIGADKRGLNAAGARGTAIHSVMEDMAAGRTQLLEVDSAAQPYMEACRMFLDDIQPEWLLSEVVAINRTVGYGGTFDALVKIAGKSYWVDWKSRAVGKHAAYDEECWQVAAYSHAEYLVVETDGRAQRIATPQADGGLVVSLTPEGYRLYPLDLDAGWEAFQALNGLWSAKRLKVVGKSVVLAAPTQPRVLPPVEAPPVVAATVIPAAGDPDTRAWLFRRLQDDGRKLGDQRGVIPTYWPEDIPSLKGDHPHTGVELGLIEHALDRLERDHQLPFGESRPGDPAMAMALLPLRDDPVALIAVGFAADTAEHAARLVAQLADGTAQLVTDDEGVTTLVAPAQPQPQEALL